MHLSLQDKENVDSGMWRRERGGAAGMQNKIFQKLKVCLKNLKKCRGANFYFSIWPVMSNLKVEFKYSIIRFNLNIY